MNNFSTSNIFSSSISKVYLVPRNLCHIVNISTCDVPPLTGAIARSIISAPASIAAKLHATPIPAVSWV